MADSFAYIDESGNEGMDLDSIGVSPTYVVVALQMSAEEKGRAQTVFSAARSRYFRSSEMKSAAIGDDDLKRTHVLTDLLACPFMVLALVVDKCSLRELDAPGYCYPKSFIKNIQQRIYSRLLAGQRCIQVVADRIKSAGFTNEFRRYIEAHNVSDLFRYWDYKLVDSAESVQVQAADVIAGTIRLLVESRQASDSSRVWRELLRNRVKDFQEFPKPRHAAPASLTATSEQDASIERHALMLVTDYLERQHSDDPEIRLQMECARVLYVRGYLRDTEIWVPTTTLIGCLAEVADENPSVTVQTLRHTVGQLRDAGLLIASRKAGGYKLPTCVADMCEFVERQRATIEPLMHRVLLARRAIGCATKPTIDILGSDPLRHLRDALEAGEEWLPINEPLSDDVDNEGT